MGCGEFQVIYHASDLVDFDYQRDFRVHPKTGVLAELTSRPFKMAVTAQGIDLVAKFPTIDVLYIKAKRM